MTIRLLPSLTVNRIAAGEVIERPASAVKELVENAIDAGASLVTITLHTGGKNLIRVVDNGKGMQEEDLLLCVERHATSKLAPEDEQLLHIMHLGFRGEALAAIGAVSQLTITTRTVDKDSASSLKIIGGVKHEICPISAPTGTCVEVRDLFFATPARLKFLKSDTSEWNYTNDIVEKLAMAHPLVGFMLHSEKRAVTSLPVIAINEKEDPYLRRYVQVMGKDFEKNAVPVSLRGDYFTITGYITLPTFHRATATGQYLIVNKRPVKEKLLTSAIRVAYHDMIPKDRHPSIVLMLEIDPDYIDVNVHPAKTEIRFRDSQMIHQALMKAMRGALVEHAHKSSPSISHATSQAFEKEPLTALHEKQETYAFQATPSVLQKSYAPSFTKQQPITWSPQNIPISQEKSPPPVHKVPMETVPTKIPFVKENYLGNARCQLHSTYIISETSQGVVIIDQHAAHERILYEKFKENLRNNAVESQCLLKAEIIDLTPSAIETLMLHKETLSSLGITVNIFGSHAVSVSSVPVMLKEIDIRMLIKDIADTCEEYQEPLLLRAALEEKLSSQACHYSIRAGRNLHLTEMQALIHSMEETKFSGQCNHGRPTYITLTWEDLEKLFGRSGLFTGEESTQKKP